MYYIDNYRRVQNLNYFGHGGNSLCTGAQMNCAKCITSFRMYSGRVRRGPKPTSRTRFAVIEVVPMTYRVQNTRTQIMFTLVRGNLDISIASRPMTFQKSFLRFKNFGGQRPKIQRHKL